MFTRIRVALLRSIAVFSGVTHKNAQKHAYLLGYHTAQKPARPVKGYELQYFNGRKHALDMLQPFATDINVEYLTKQEKFNEIIENGLTFIARKVKAIESRLDASTPPMYLEAPKAARTVSHEASAPVATEKASSAAKPQDNGKYVMPFGKYKGQELGIIPNTYYEYLAKNLSVSPKLEKRIMDECLTRGLDLTQAFAEGKRKKAEEEKAKAAAEQATADATNSAPATDQAPDFSELDESAI